VNLRGLLLCCTSTCNIDKVMLQVSRKRRFESWSKVCGFANQSSGGRSLPWFPPAVHQHGDNSKGWRSGERISSCGWIEWKKLERLQNFQQITTGITMAASWQNHNFDMKIAMTDGSGSDDGLSDTDQQLFSIGSCQRTRDMKLKSGLQQQLETIRTL